MLASESEIRGPWSDRWYDWVTVGPPLVTLIAGLVAPLVAASTDLGRLGPERALFQAHVASDIVARTIILAGISSAAATLVAWAFALSVVGWPPRLRRAAVTACLLPVSVHFILRAYGLHALFGRHGPVNGLLLGVGLVHHPLPITYSSVGTVLALTAWVLPPSVFFMNMVLQRIPRELAEAAVSLGAGPTGVLRAVWLPLSKQGAALLMAINFPLAYGTYLSPELLGGLEDITLVRLIAQMLREGRSAEAAWVATLGTAAPVAAFTAFSMLSRRLIRSGT